MPTPEKPDKPTKQRPGKPTIDQGNHDRNVGQRGPSHAGGPHGKPTIAPDTHDENIGQRDVIDEEENGRRPDGQESSIADNGTLTDDREVE